MTTTPRGAAAADAEALIEIGKLQEAFSLTRPQAEGLHRLMERSSERSAEALCLRFPDTKLRRLSARRIPGGGHCDLRHKIYNAYTVECESAHNPELIETHVLGSTCVSHVLNLPEAVKIAVVGLSKWTRGIDREMPLLLGRLHAALKGASVPDHLIGQRITEDYRKGSEYPDVVRMLKQVKGREKEAAQPAAKERRRNFNIARLLHAISVLELCDEVGLPFAPTAVKRLRQASRRLDLLAKQGAAQAAAQPVPFPAAVATPAAAASPNTIAPPPVTPAASTPPAATHVGGGQNGVSTPSKNAPAPLAAAGVTTSGQGVLFS